MEGAEACLAVQKRIEVLMGGELEDEAVMATALEVNDLALIALKVRMELLEIADGTKEAPEVNAGVGDGGKGDGDDGKDKHNEPGKNDEDGSQCREDEERRRQQHREEGVQLLIDGVHVLGEPGHDAADRRRVEKVHRRAHHPRRELRVQSRRGGYRRARQNECTHKGDERERYSEDGVARQVEGH